MRSYAFPPSLVVFVQMAHSVGQEKHSNSGEMHQEKKNRMKGALAGAKAVSGGSGVRNVLS